MITQPTPQPTGMIAVQAASAEVVGKVLSGKNLDRVLEADLAKLSRTIKLSPNERAAIHSISFDTLRHYGLLAAQLDLLLTQPINDPPVRHLLLVALSQLQFSKAAPHAIVDHAVSAAEAIGFGRAKPLLNAVLRNYLRAPEKFARERLTSQEAQFDFPRWWIERVKKEQPANWEAVLLSARSHPPMCLRVNTKRVTPADYVAILAKQGVAAYHVFGQAVMLEKPIGVNELPGFREGQVSVQDVGAQLAAILLAPAAGSSVLDACAAPGGKTGHILEMAVEVPALNLLAIDSDRRRLTRVDDNLTRLGLRAQLKTADASKPDEWWDGKLFDRILLDVPCSGSGVTRRHPDIKWIRRETDIFALARQQARLLSVLWSCLNIGGRLLYATCSVFRAENQDIVEQFLRKTPGARQLNFAEMLPVGVEHGAAIPALSEGQLLPNNVHDGFFYALLEKTG
ncbi:MAG: 16S rRNA (cytosine(967)-C(5))-methyltransferase RsmB [Burkholderiales bacterium]|nr:16S rRNA (cytosine(967)-C(5))-methyltransferase RsmB [Burkholderiales bacterium]